MNYETHREYDDGQIAVWFSGGVPSACALKLAVDRFGVDRVRAVHNPVMEEHSDNHRFADEVADWCGVHIERATHAAYPTASAVDVWSARKGMAFPHGAPCTRHLKIEARQQWESRNPVSWHVLGFTVEEIKRHERFTLTERENVIPVLIDAGMTRDKCFSMIHKAGIAMPEVYSLGYPNANCIGCVKATSPTYWNLVRSTFPEVFEARAVQSRALGARLVRVRGERIFLDELDPAAQGRPLLTAPDCGAFCEEVQDEL